MTKTLIYNLPPLDQTRPSVSGAILANICSQQGHQCSVVDLQWELSEWAKKQNLPPGFFDDVFYEQSPSFDKHQLDALTKFCHNHLDNFHTENFDYVFVSLFSYLAQKFAVIFLPLLRAHTSAAIVIGGAGLVHVKNMNNQLAFAQNLKNNGVINEFIIGEAEQSVPQYLKHGHGPGIGNYDFQQIEDLDAQPWPDYRFFDLNRYACASEQELVIIGSRGCVRRCTFCDVAKSSPKYRYRSGKNIASEIIHHYETHGVTRYYFADSLVNGSFRAFDDMCNALAAYKFDKPISWTGQYIIRSKQSTPKNHFDLLKQSGCSTLFVGLESGSDRVRKELGKPFTNDDTEYYLENFCANDIKVLFLMFTGYVSETEQDHAETLSLFRRWQKYVATGTIQGVETLNILAILPGTQLAESARANKWLFMTDQHDELNIKWWLNPSNPGFDFSSRVSRHIDLMEEAMKYKWPLWNGSLAIALYEQSIKKFVKSPKRYITLPYIPISTAV